VSHTRLFTTAQMWTADAGQSWHQNHVGHGKTSSDTLMIISKTNQHAPSLFLSQESASEYLFYVGKGI